MKPLGTITMFYPFLDSETRSVLDSIMETSNTYRDFVRELGDRVCTNESPVHLAYVAAVHAWQLADLETMKQIGTRYRDNAVIKPWTLHERFPDSRANRLVQIREAIEAAIASNPEDWILVQLPQASESFLEPTTEFTKLVEDAGSLLANRTDLECFKSGFHNLNSWIYALDGDTENALSEIRAGLEIAKRYDDRYRTMKLLTDFANLTKNSDVRSALAHLEDAYIICTELDSKHDKSSILNEMGLVSSILGEYDLALKCHLDCVRYEEDEGSLGYFATLNLSQAYLNIDDPLGALACAESAMECAEPGRLIWSHLAMVRCFVDLYSLEEAAYHLDLAQSMVLKSGHETVLGQYYYALGLYEKALGEVETAVQTLEQALDIYERHSILLYVVYCLLALSEGELDAARRSGPDENTDSSGPWMSRLWETAEDYDLPGIKMRHNRMKSELQLMQGRKDLARTTLEDALAFSDSPGVRTLREGILSDIESIENAP